MTRRPSAFLLALSLAACSTPAPQSPPIVPERPGGGGGAGGRSNTGPAPTGGMGGSTGGSTGQGGSQAGSGGSAGTAGSSGTAGSAATGGTGGTATSDGPPSNTTDDAGATTDGPAADVTISADTGNGGGDDAGGSGGPGPTTEAMWSYTACNKKALMFPKIDKNNGVFPIGSCPPPEDLNRNCGGNSKIAIKAATAQTWENGYWHPPEYAFDQYLMTRWSSHTMVTSWLQLDLGTEQTFRRIYLAWELAHGSDYDIVTSNDGMTWTMLKQVRGGNGFQDILDVEGKARYVRMNGVKRGNVGEGPYGYSLFDVTICGERP
jgi:hypothetical protein